MIAYVDASVLLRIVLGEPNPIAEWEDLEPVASELTRVESLRVIDRLRVLGSVDDAVMAGRRAWLLIELAHFHFAPVSSEVLARASDPFPTALGTLDAIQLASALMLRESIPDLQVATHDQELAVGARSMGFEVLGAEAM